MEIDDQRILLGKDIFYGTSSWSEKSWIGTFYPSSITPSLMLTHYATQFRSVEADVTYYRIPSRRMVQNWFQATPIDFVMSAKFPRSIVHAGEERLPNADKLLLPDFVGHETLDFLEIMRGLDMKLGPIVLQFPYFNKSVFSEPSQFLNRLDLFLGWLPVGYRYAVEIRNRNYLLPEFFDVLRKHGSAFVLADISYMPHPIEIFEKLDLVTADFVYVRLIGNRKAVEEKSHSFDRIVIDQSSRLKQWAEILIEFISQHMTVFMYANNHFAGHGPASIRQLVQLIKENC
ncbi:DUF72 domain-containing protein [bacterium]|nr:DUF72 domain-containing protein [candidate division CSSED10-310 bacterium]